MQSGTNIGPDNSTKMEPDTGKRMKGHSAPEMEAQSWTFNLFFEHIVNRIQTWATEK